jgi:hypothetical protein
VWPLTCQVCEDEVVVSSDGVVVQRHASCNTRNTELYCQRQTVSARFTIVFPQHISILISGHVSTSLLSTPVTSYWNDRLKYPQGKTGKSKVVTRTVMNTIPQGPDSLNSKWPPTN